MRRAGLDTGSLGIQCALAEGLLIRRVHPRCRSFGRVDLQCRLAISRSPGAISTGEGTHQHPAFSITDSAGKANA